MIHKESVQIGKAFETVKAFLWAEDVYLQWEFQQ